MKLSKKLRKLYFGEETDAILSEIEQLEHDAELGALVRRMPAMSALAHGVTQEGKGPVWNYCKQDKCDRFKMVDWIGFNTPQEALRKALDK